MKKEIFTIISMFVFLTTSGQQINHSNNRYRGHGDGSADHFSAKALVK